MKKLKCLTLALCTWCVFTLPIGSFAQESLKLRAFMQKEDSAPNAVQYGNNPTAGRYVQSGDAKIYYEVYGKGEPFFVLHGGIVGSTYEMGRLIDSLSTSYRVVAISTRGHGRSEMGNVEPTYEQKAEDVKTVMSAEGVEHTAILGFSDGAYTGYCFAARYPSKIDKLIAIGAGEWIKGEHSFRLNREAVIGQDSLYWRQQLAMMPQPERFDQWLSSLSNYYNRFGMGEEVFKKISTPLLLLAGEKDQNAPLKSILKAYSLIPKVQLGIIPNAPHPVFQVNFDAVWAVIVPFIDFQK